MALYASKGMVSHKNLALWYVFDELEQYAEEMSRTAPSETEKVYWTGRLMGLKVASVLLREDALSCSYLQTPPNQIPADAVDWEIVLGNMEKKNGLELQ